jgi:hypothetical protein
VGFAQQEYQQLSRTYLRALCRMYLIDYMCLNYTMPMDCQNIPTELLEVVDDHYRFKAHKQVQHFDSISDILRLFLPTTWLQRIATLACMNAPSPDCEARFVHGIQVVEDIDRHDEL